MVTENVPVIGVMISPGVVTETPGLQAARVVAKKIVSNKVKRAKGLSPITTDHYSMVKLIAKKISEQACNYKTLESGYKFVSSGFAFGQKAWQ
jgi:hypothetical protein